MRANVSHESGPSQAPNPRVHLSISCLGSDQRLGCFELDRTQVGRDLIPTLFGHILRFARLQFFIRESEPSIDEQEIPRSALPCA